MSLVELMIDSVYDRDGYRVRDKEIERSGVCFRADVGESSGEIGSRRLIVSESRIRKSGISNFGKLDRKSPAESRKRRVSPTVWNSDDEGVCRSAKSRISPATATNLPFSNISVANCYADTHAAVQISHPKETVAQINGSLPDKIEVAPRSHVSSASESPRGISPAAPREDAEELEKEFRMGSNLGAEALNNDEYTVTRSIYASKWADDAESPVDNAEIIDDEEMHESITKKSISSSEIIRKSGTPKSVERMREGSISTTSVRSGSRDSFTDGSDNDDYLDISGNSLSDSDSDFDKKGPSHQPTCHIVPPSRSVNMLQACRSIDDFERLNKINEGTYGIVYRAKDKKTGEIVALKKVKMEREREGFPLTSLREINILLALHHPSIVDVKEVVVSRNLDSIYMVMEYMEHDLKGLMDTTRQPFCQSEVKCLMLQLLKGVKYLHDNWVIHRDLKTSNLLFNNCGELKICDFGMARQFGSLSKAYTQLVVTLWYRAPELLLGDKEYSTAIDMWSLGCIMAELLLKEPLFNGKTECDQLDKIFRILGTPNESIWPGVSELPGMNVNFIKHRYKLHERFPTSSRFTASSVLSSHGFDLLNRLLTYNPAQRITAEDALEHPWFGEFPLPTSKDFMPTFPPQHALERRMRSVRNSNDPFEQRLEELQRRDLPTGGLFG